MDWKPLVDAATEARRNAHAPFSGYRVGAALLAADGTVYPGANVELGIPALGVCAERAAVIGALNAGAEDFRAVVVVTDDPRASEPASPCGLCRQTLAEVTPADRDLPVLTVNLAGGERLLSLGGLLPHPFRFHPGAEPPA